MSSYLIINTTTNIVENNVVWDGDTDKWNPPTGFVAVGSTEGGIGWKYNSGGVGIGSTSGDTTKKWIPQIGYGATV
tara:strand:- start:2647 stop:2874 length:228 start_codon:yes stop_codon:yes gene_type:complete